MQIIRPKFIVFAKGEIIHDQHGKSIAMAMTDLTESETAELVNTITQKILEHNKVTPGWSPPQAA